MFDVELKDPKSKKRKFGEPKQPFPVPISSLTELRPNDSLWRWYRGKLDRAAKKVILCANSEDVEQIYTMGFFGSVDEKKFRKRKRDYHSEDSVPVLQETVPTLDGGCDITPTAELLSGSDAIAGLASSDSEENESEGNETPLLPRLDYVEAFFLSFALGCLIVEDDVGQELSLDGMWTEFSAEKDFCQNYAVYHHFRAKGWVVKAGRKFGSDFLLYKDGPPHNHSSYSVRIERDGAPVDALTWKSLSGLNRITESTGKELLIVRVSEKTHGYNTGSEHPASPILDRLSRINVEETLVRRWVPSQDRAQCKSSK